MCVCVWWFGCVDGLVVLMDWIGNGIRLGMRWRWVHTYCASIIYYIRLPLMLDALSLGHCFCFCFFFSYSRLSWLSLLVLVSFIHIIECKGVYISYPLPLFTSMTSPIHIPHPSSMPQHQMTHNLVHSHRNEKTPFSGLSVKSSSASARWHLYQLLTLLTPASFSSASIAQ